MSVGIQGEARPCLPRTCGLGVSLAPSWDGESWGWGRSREPARPPPPPVPIPEDDLSWMVLEFFFGQTLSLELNCHHPGEACVFSSCPLHTWCGMGTQECQVREVFQLQNRALQEATSCPLLEVFGDARRQPVCAHWHRGPLRGVKSDSGREFGDYSHVMNNLQST